MDLVHISHVGWNPNTGSDVLSEDAQLKSDDDPPAVPPRGPPRASSGSGRPAPPPPPVVTRIPVQENYAAPKKSHPPFSPKQLGGGGPAPPPPPPPLMNMHMPPPVMDNRGAVPSPVMADGGSALMKSKEGGTTLKHVEDRAPAPVDVAQDDLLSAIRKIQLKPFGKRKLKPSDNPFTAKYLAEIVRRPFVDEIDDDTSSTSNDEEWY